MNNENHKKNGYHTFLTECPEVAQAFGGLIQTLGEHGGLDPKTRQLIYIGIRAAQGEPGQ